MKQNLLKILALTAMGLSLVSCSDSSSSSESGAESEAESEVESEEEVEAVAVTAAGLMSLASDGSWEYLGQRVAISESMSVGGNYGNNYFCTQTSPTSRLYGVEVEVAEDPGFSGSGYGAEVYVEGTVTDVNGRMVLTDAVFSNINERQFDEDGKTISGTGGSVYYYSGWGRASWDGTLNRTYSSILYEDVYALITVPGTVTADSETYFYVTFPGEYSDADFETNTSLIKVTIPSGLGATAISSINTFFANYEAGDFIDLTCYWQYDSVSNYGMGLVLENYWGQIGLEEGSADVYNTFAEAAASVQSYYAEDIPDLGSDSVFSWTVYDYASAGYTAKDLYSSPYVTNPSECSMTEFTGNALAANIATVMSDIETALANAGYTAIYTYSATKSYYFGTLTDTDGVVTSQVYVEDCTTYVVIEYVAELAETAAEYTSETGAWADVNARLAALNTSYPSYFPAATALPTLASANVTYTSIVVDDYTGYISNGKPIYYLELVVYCSDPYTSAIAYLTALVNDAGFVSATNGAFSSSLSGYYNSSTGEFIMIGYSTDGGYFYISDYVMPAYAGYITVASSGSSGSETTTETETTTESETTTETETTSE